MIYGKQNTANCNNCKPHSSKPTNNPSSFRNGKIKNHKCSRKGTHRFGSFKDTLYLCSEKKPPPKCTFVLSVRSFAYFHRLRPAEHCTPHRENSYSMNSRPASPFRGEEDRRQAKRRTARLKLKDVFGCRGRKPDHLPNTQHCSL